MLKGTGMKISDYLMTGAENALTAAELMSILHCSRRDIVRAVENERFEGVLIIGSKSMDNPGYYLAATYEEAARFISRRRSSGAKIYKQADILERAARSMPDAPAGQLPGQINITDYIETGKQ